MKKKAAAKKAARPATSARNTARWDDARTLHRLFGAVDGSPQLSAFLKQLGPVTAESHTLGKTYAAREQGLAVYLIWQRETDDTRVWGFYLMAPKCEGFRNFKPYPGRLPQGLQWSDRRNELSPKLGEPAVVPAGRIAPATYTFLMNRYRLVFALSKNEESKIDSIWVGEVIPD